MDVRNNKFLAFLLGNESYAVSIMAVKEIIGITEITAIPKVPKFIKGVINLKGKIVPVIDMRLKFGMPEKPYGPRTCIIIIEIRDEGDLKLMGVIVDTVSEVLAIDETEMQPPPELSGADDMNFIKGIGKTHNKVIWILNLDKILNTGELVLIKKIKGEKQNV